MMRIVIGSAQRLNFAETINVLLRAGHRVAASVPLTHLPAQVQAEDPDVVLLVGHDYAHIAALDKPVLLIDPAMPQVAGATVVPDWPSACRLLQDWPAGSAAAMPAPKTWAPEETQEAIPAADPAGTSSPGAPLWVYPVLGGVGASTLAVTLAA